MSNVRNTKRYLTLGGSTFKTHKIGVNGEVMLVTTNMLLALHYLRHFYEDRVLWIDAICIDQNKDKERGCQVLQMALIYKKAEQVVIWLDLPTEETDLVFDCMSEIEKKAVNHACRNLKVTDKRWLDIWQSVISPPDGKQLLHGNFFSDVRDSPSFSTDYGLTGSESYKKLPTLGRLKWPVARDRSWPVSMLFP